MLCTDGRALSLSAGVLGFSSSQVADYILTLIGPCDYLAIHTSGRLCLAEHASMGTLHTFVAM